MPQLLVVYFPRSGWRGYWRSAREALRGRTVEIEPATHLPRDYSLVVIGTPVWAGNVSSPARLKYCNGWRSSAAGNHWLLQSSMMQRSLPAATPANATLSLPRC